MKIFACLKEKDADEVVAFVFDSKKRMNEVVSDYNATVVAVHPLVVSGKTYAERKSSLRDLALDVDNLLAENSGGSISMFEMFELSSFFEERGDRYGLLEEFRENCIC